MLRKIIKDCLGSVALAESMDDEAEGNEDDNAADGGELEGHEYDEENEEDDDDDDDDDDGDDGDDQFDYDDVSF
jgi:hypothetical protein